MKWSGPIVKNSRIYQTLRTVDAFRSAINFVKHLPLVVGEPLICRPGISDRKFLLQEDPWKYESDLSERERFDTQTKLIDSVRGEALFDSGVEIGCAEGAYTEILAERCASLLILDISSVALSRAQKRRQWPHSVQFRRFNLRLDEIYGTFDLIVVTGVLEYFGRRRTHVRVRQNLVDALNAGGYLLVETTRTTMAAEKSWWAKYLYHGRWLNTFISKHPALCVMREVLLDKYVITLFQKI